MKRVNRKKTAVGMKRVKGTTRVRPEREKTRGLHTDKKVEY